MDISTVKQHVERDETSQPIPIYQKDGDPYLAADGVTPATISVVGSESKRYKATKTRIQRAALRSRRSTIDVEDVAANRLALAASAVTGWSGWEHGEQPWPCTDANIKELLSIEHILEQVETGIRTHADFFKNNSES